MMIEVSRLPKTALIDTGVFLRFLGDMPQDAKAPVCKAFCQAMLREQRELYIAAPTITEALRFNKNAGVRKLPPVKGIQVIAFDERAAILLGEKGSEHTVTAIAQANKSTKNCIKYDFLIAACALRAKAEVLVAVDSDFDAICKCLGIPYKQPVHYEHMSLFSSPPMPSAKADPSR